MILLTFLNDEDIDRPKLTEQKNPFGYIVPSPTSNGTNIFEMRLLKMVLLVAFKYIADKLENKVSNTELFWLVKRRMFQECPETTKTGMY